MAKVICWECGNEFTGSPNEIYCPKCRSKARARDNEIISNIDKRGFNLLYGAMLVQWAQDYKKAIYSWRRAYTATEKKSRYNTIKNLCKEIKALCNDHKSATMAIKGIHQQVYSGDTRRYENF